MVTAKSKCQNLFQKISDATSTGIYRAVTNEKSEKKKLLSSVSYFQKQPFRGVLIKKYSENMQQIIGEHPYQSAFQIY